MGLIAWIHVGVVIEDRRNVHPVLRSVRLGERRGEVGEVWRMIDEEIEEPVGRGAARITDHPEHGPSRRDDLRLTGPRARREFKQRGRVKGGPFVRDNRIVIGGEVLLDIGGLFHVAAANKRPVGPLNQAVTFREDGPDTLGLLGHAQEVRALEFRKRAAQEQRFKLGNPEAPSVQGPAGTMAFPGPGCPTVQDVFRGAPIELNLLRGGHIEPALDRGADEIGNAMETLLHVTGFGRAPPMGPIVAQGRATPAAGGHQVRS